MQVIENLTRLEGPLLRRAPHPRLTDYELITLQVDNAQPVQGKADLLSRHRGQTLEIAVRRELLQTVPESGPVHLSLRAKMTPDGPMAEPHPEPGDLLITSDPNTR